MENQEKREAQGTKTEEAGPKLILRRRITAEERAELAKSRPLRSCFDCVFCLSNVAIWARTLLSAFPIGGMCANHPDTPGQLRPVPHTACRNFRAKPLRVEPPTPPNDRIRYIPLTRGLHAIVDAEDYEWLSQYKWYAGSNKSSRTLYARRYSPQGIVLMHRMIMNPPKGLVVDHINGNGLDNRRCNLHICTQKQNTQRRRKSSGQSKYVGVSPCGNKWQATIRGLYLGLFDDEVEAAKVRDRKALEVYGQRAWLNFPPESEPINEQQPVGGSQ